MGVRKIKKYKPLPFEEGRTYRTKMQTGEKFTISKIVSDPFGNILKFMGVYESSPHLGDCPLNPDRLNPDMVEDGEVEVCDNPKCGFPIHEKFKKN